MKNITLNINNLTWLWQVASSNFPNNFNDDYFECAYIKNTQWPSRIWSKKAQSIEYLEKTKEKLSNIHKDLTFSHFHIANKGASLQNNPNIQLKSVQYGMSLPLENKFKTKKSLEFELVENKMDVQIWSDSFYKAFRYEISSDIIVKTKDKIPFYLIYSEKELIGTIILFITDKTAGIHSLGIIPEKRKQGFATEIMHHILNKSIDQNLSLATLQASEMAKEMYLKMGFSIDFLMENYQIK